MAPLGSHTQVSRFCRFSALSTESSSQPHSTHPSLSPSLLPSLSPCSHTNTSIYSQILNYFIVSNSTYLCVCAHVLPLCTCVYLHVRVCMCGRTQRTTCRSHFSPTITWFRRIKLRLSGSATSQLSGLFCHLIDVSCRIYFTETVAL